MGNREQLAIIPTKPEEIEETQERVEEIYQKQKDYKAMLDWQH